MGRFQSLIQVYPIFTWLCRLSAKSRQSKKGTDPFYPLGFLSSL